MTVFYSTTHFPFASPYPYYKRYADLSYRGPHRYHKYTIVGRKETTTASDERQVGDLYDGALRAVDEQVGRLLDELERRGLADNTIVFLFGDHGEDLYESPDIPVIHGEQLRSEYSPKTALVVAGPNIPRGRRIDARIPMIDLAPTVAWYAGMPLRAPEGQSLAPLIDGTESGDRPVFIETGLWYALEGNGFYQQRRLPYPDVTAILEVDPEDNHEIVLQKQWAALTNAAKHQAVILDDWKLIRMPLVEGDAFELYDLDADPECRKRSRGRAPRQSRRAGGSAPRA
ncbi:MAG: sulfatase-like hydrolase/transferase [Deltaproteobacteria bacterium]|nr:sulfatase-like hydrolase/transferase [Deltaproteobacteria bacterium]